MTEQAKVPAIRFAGFTDPWEQRKLGEIVSIGAGAPPSAFSAGNFLYVKVDDLNESSHFQFDSAQRVDANTAVKPIRKGSIIFAKRGAAILGNKVRVLGKTAYIDTNMMALEPRGVDADFLWLFINQTGLYRIADTSTIPQINNKHIEPYPVDIPNMAEQQAIGTFFSRLDDLITLHQRKYDKLVIFKKSMLEKMFPKDGESVPEIRFAGFTDPWEQRKLGDIAERVTRKNENNESDLPLTISAQHGLIDQRLFFNAQVASRDMSGYYLLRQGEFAYNKSTSADSPWGAIKRLTRYEKGCVSTLYICFALLNANPDYLVTYYETNRWHKAVQMIAAEGARNHGLLNIAPDDFFDTMVSLPESQAEQQTIGAFFSRLDSLITLHQRKLELLQDIKKSLLDKMFV
ncbi:restriction endonuclease subunit S [Bifidobacterium longum]|uniref:restriction endonuclease subunit S n=1 Tax=Bifidobacterium longum TaxID=216816 RepID=UPI0004D9E531|nr:restriction endonuclease subunit S [Bifidobacterium longum subsp. longum 7-1B]